MNAQPNSSTETSTPNANGITHEVIAGSNMITVRYRGQQFILFADRYGVTMKYLFLDLPGEITPELARLVAEALTLAASIAEKPLEAHS